MLMSRLLPHPKSGCTKNTPQWTHIDTTTLSYVDLLANVFYLKSRAHVGVLLSLKWSQWIFSADLCNTSRETSISAGDTWHTVSCRRPTNMINWQVTSPTKEKKYQHFKLRVIYTSINYHSVCNCNMIMA